MKRSQWLYEIITYLLVLLFFYTALSKLMDWHHFVRKMGNQIFPKPVASLLVVLVPLIEFVSVFLLIRIKTRVYGLWLSLILMVSFTIYVGLATFRLFPRMPCTCAGVFKAMTWTQHFVFNIVFTLLTATAIYFGNRQKNASANALAS